MHPWDRLAGALSPRDQGSHSPYPLGDKRGRERLGKWSGPGHPISSDSPEAVPFQVINGSITGKTDVLENMSQEAEGKPVGAFYKLALNP